ncbi:MAG: squalene--hopene cyclase [Bryobacteraceae bacterium]|nr:squalene--hopene cyclase [Bryobacteraceae bacterium]
MSTSVQTVDALSAGVSHAIRRASEALLAQRHDQTYWWAHLTADTTLESDYILLELWLHPPRNGVWNPPTRPRIDKAAQSILARQLPDGGFNIYPEGPADVSATVKAYFALKVSGLGPNHPALRRARKRILDLGGIQAANSYVKINLSLFNLYPRQHRPTVPPEIMLLPWKFIYQMSSWTRAIVIPLAIVQALNPGKPVPAGFTLEELFTPDRSMAFPRDEKTFTWKNVFYAFDRVLKIWERRGPRGIRAKAIRRAEQWMLERTRYSDGLGAIYPPMMYVIMALDLLGYPPEHPDRAEAERQFFNLIVDDGESFFFQPCFSPVWDTAIAGFAVGEAGGIPTDALTRTADWMLSKEVRRKGDWAVKRPGVEPGGWYFEFANEFYPDIDDTAMVLLALKHMRASSPQAQEAAQRRAIRWLLAMQSRDGGWAAFDVDNNWEPLACVPFADHNAMLDPTCPDITGRVMEALCSYGFTGDHPAIRRGVEYLKRTQEPDGSWYGRWGVDYVYGTFLALRGLRAAGENSGAPYIRRAAEWLRGVQNADGGWGETCASYDKGRFVAGPSTPSQTAWGVMGLIAADEAGSSNALRGVEHLVETQRDDGCWDETPATGTGFPRVFYLCYHLYRNSFPLLALASFQKAVSSSGRNHV